MDPMLQIMVPCLRFTPGCSSAVLTCNLVAQGIKIAGAVEKLREQAQEQIRRTQEQMRKQQELKKAPRGGPDAKPSGKQA